MWPSHFCRVRVTSPSSQRHQKNFRVIVESWLGRVTRTVESLRVIGLQARINVESHEISHFFYDIFYVMKWHPTCYKMVPDKLENGVQHGMKWYPIIKKNDAQCCFNKFDCRLFISKFSPFEFYLSLSLSVISKSPPNLAASVATYCLALCWMRDSPLTGCAWRTTPIYMQARNQPGHQVRRRVF